MMDWILTRHPLEALAFLLSLVALGLTFWPLRPALALHAQFVKQNLGGPIRLISTVTVVAMQTRMAIAAVCVLASGAALHLAPPATFPQPVIYSFSVILISVCLGVNILVDHHTQYDLRWMDQDQNSPKTTGSTHAA